MIQAAEKFYVAVGQVAREVAGSVEARARLLAEGIRDELFRGQCGPETVAAREAVAADVQLAGYTRRDRMQVFVQQVHARVGDRSSDGRRGCRLGLLRDGGARGDNRVLRRPVMIDQDEGESLARVSVQYVAAG